MKRFWLEIQGSSIDINATNDTVNINAGITSTTTVLTSKIYTLRSLADEFNLKGIEARVGGLNSDTKKQYIVLFLDDSVTYLDGSFVDFVNGIEQDSESSIINGAEAFLEFYIPDEAKFVNISRNPNWDITKNDLGNFDYVYTNTNDGTTNNGSLELVGNKIYRVEDTLPSFRVNNYDLTYKDLNNNVIANSKMSLKTNSGQTSSTPFPMAYAPNDFSMMDIDVHGNIVYLKKEGVGNYSLIYRDKEGIEKTLLTNQNTFSTVSPIEIDRYGSFIKLVTKVDGFINSFTLQVLDTAGTNLATIDVFSDHSSDRPKYVLNRFFTKIVYTNQIVDTFLVQSIGGGNLIEHTILFSEIVGLSSNNFNSKPKLLYVNDDASKFVFSVLVNQITTVYMIDVATKTVLYSYQVPEYNADAVYDIKSVNGDIVFIAQRAKLNSNNRYRAIVTKLNIDWINNSIDETNIVIDDGTTYSDKYKSYGLSVDRYSENIYLSLNAHDDGDTTIQKGIFCRFNTYEVFNSIINPVNTNFYLFKDIKDVFGVAIDDRNVISYLTYRQLYKEAL